jgi:hypothetical protein
MATLFLFGAMLIVMATRVAPPLGVRIEGDPIGRITLGMRERVRLQRTNIYAIGLVLLLVTATSSLPLIAELAVIVGVLAILAIPTRYVLTTEGIALNRTVFRRWSEFEAFEVDAGGIKFVPRSGLRGFRIVTTAAKSQEISRTLRRFLTVVQAERRRAEASARS